jgi:uncharacterized membrane protein HdeD (DUF308 family)
MNGIDREIASLARNWWVLVVRGVAAIIFGALTFVLPGVSLAALVLLFGSYALVDGVFNIVAAVRRSDDARPWWALLLGGIAGIAAGIITFVYPGVTAIVLLYVIAWWAVITGVLEILAAVRLRKQTTGEWWLAASGALSIILGVLLVAAPGAGALALVLWIGAYAVVSGVLLIALGVRLRRWREQPRMRVAQAA